MEHSSGIFNKHCWYAAKLRRIQTKKRGWRMSSALLIKYAINPAGWALESSLLRSVPHPKFVIKMRWEATRPPTSSILELSWVLRLVSFLLLSLSCREARRRSGARRQSRLYRHCALPTFQNILKLLRALIWVANEDWPRQRLCLPSLCVFAGNDAIPQTNRTESLWLISRLGGHLKSGTLLRERTIILWLKQKWLKRKNTDS